LPNWLYRNVEEWVIQPAADASLTVSVADTVAVAESVVVTLNPLLVVVADSDSPSESVTITLNPLLVVVADTDSPSESVTVRIPMAVQVSDALTASESVTAQILDTPPSFGPSVVDSTISHDAALVWLTRQDRDIVLAVRGQTAPPPAAVDTVTVDELARVQIGVTPSVNDAVTVGEAVTGFMGIPVSVNDASAAAELVLVALSVLTIRVHDDTPAAELAMVSFRLEVVAVDAVVPGDVVSVRQGLVVFDVTTLDDAVVVQMPLAVVVVDSASPSELVAGEFNGLPCSVSDSAPVTDTAALHRNFAVSVFDADVVDERRFAAMAKVKKVKVRGGPS
jgi:hypothetical protein